MQVALIILVAFVLIISVYSLMKKNTHPEDSAKSEFLSSLQSTISEQKRELDEKQRRIDALIEELATSRTRLDDLKHSMAEQEIQRDAMSRAFENLANEILDNKGQQMQKSNREQIDLMLKPLNERLKVFGDQVENVYRSETQDRVALKEQVVQLTLMNKHLADEAAQLANALKGDNKLQGNWGEMVLEKLLESCGLEEGVGYEKQEVTTNSAGETIKPDVIINMPDHRHMIIDSKVSLLAYNGMVNAADHEDAERFLKLHLDSIKAHIKGIGDKYYHTGRGLHSPDFILLFIPIESALVVALQREPGLYNMAYDKNVVLVSPTLLLATLRTVANVWMQERRIQNIQEILSAAGGLYDKFQGYLESMLEVGKKLEAAQDSYNTAMNRLSTGRGNIIKRAADLKKMGVPSTKEIPQELSDRAHETDTDE
jgi:DNA recombination protein RmuC